MGTGLRPSDVFGRQPVKLVVDTGDCWEWQGAMATIQGGGIQPRFHNKSVLTMAAQGAGFNYPKGTWLVRACENIKCVHPDHLALPHSDVGRLLFIKNHTVAEGDCLIWKGTLRNGQPVFPYKQEGKRSHANIAVGRFVYCQEYGLDPKTIGNHPTYSCGNKMCVNHKHIEYKRALTILCDKGHELSGKYLTWCATCKQLASRKLTHCSRGHFIESEDAAATKITGCWECRREDADAWIRERNAEALQKGRV